MSVPSVYPSRLHPNRFRNPNMIWQETHLAPRPVPVILVLKKSSKCCKKYGRKDQPVMKLSSTTCMNDKVNKLMLKLGQQIYFSTTSSLLLQFCKVPISKSNKTQEQIIQTGTPSLPVAMMLLECLKSAGVAETRDRLRLSLNTSALRMQ